MPFGTQLRRLREAAGLTQEELAGKAGLTAKGVGAIERGERKRPYPHTVRSLADALALPEDERASLLAAVRRKERVAEAPAAPAASAPAADSRPGLPAPPTPLVGREKELEEVKSFLDRPEVRLLTLTGTGGVGKTRLALEAARRAVAEELCPDGVAFVALAPLGDPALVVPAVARSLGIREAEGQTPYEALCAHLGGRRLLLVLDNFEHVLEAALEMASLVESCPNLTVLATSRAPLRVRGEQEYPVPPLALPTSTRSPTAAEVIASPSGGLFLERAKAAAPAFEVTRENASSVAAICWRLDGLPLALELAAARARFLEPRTLLGRLDQALSAGWARDVPERQRTMRATLDWSYGLLSEGEKALFRRLSVFAGGFTLEAAEAVGGAAGGVEDGEVLGLLWGLAEQSLVTTGQGPNAGEARYGMLEPVRQYALERLEEGGEAEAVRRSHAEHYHALALEAGPLLMGRDQVGWLNRTRSEQYNFRAAMRFLLDRGEIDRAISLTWAFWRYWWVTGLQGEARRWMEEVLASGELPGDDIYPARRAQANLTIGTYAWSEGNLDLALPALEEGLRLSRRTRDALAQAIGLMLLGLVDAAGRDGTRARERMEESLRLYRVAGEKWGEALTLTYLGLEPFLKGEHEPAKRSFEEGLAAAREAGDRIAAHQALYNLGLLALAQEDLERAAEYLSEGLSLAEEVRDVLNAPYFIKGLGQVAGLRNRAALAVRLLGAAETALRAMGSPPYRYVPDGSLQDRVLAASRDVLGEAAFDEEWKRGRAMTLERATAEALEAT